MATKLTFILLILSSSWILATADITAANPQSAAFNITPQMVFDTTADTVFKNTAGQVAFGSGFTNNTYYVYTVNKSADASYPITVSSRMLSYADGKLTTVAVNDTNMNATSYAWATINVATGPGYLGYVITSVGYVDDMGTPTNLTDDTPHGPTLTVCVCAANATAVTEVGVVTDAGNNLMTLKVTNFWYQSGSFYVSYIKGTTSVETFNAGTADEYTVTTIVETTAYLQSVSTAGTAGLGSSAKKVGTLSTSNYTSYYTAMSSSVNPALVNVMYRPGGSQTILTTVNGTASLAGMSINVTTDNSNQVYIPAGWICGGSVFGPALYNVTNATGSKTLIAFLNGANTSSEIQYTAQAASYLNFTSFDYLGGFGLLEYYTNNQNKETAIFLEFFLPNGTQNGTQVALGTYEAQTSWFIDVNGSAWFGYATYDKDTTMFSKAYLGRVLVETSMGGITLMSLLSALLFLMAALIAL